MESSMANQAGNSHKNSVHHALAHSYLVYFFLFLIGLSLDLAFRVSITVNPWIAPIGLLLLLAASGLILWAQKTGRDFKRARETEEITSEHFCKGPYCYTRIPTQVGLFLLMLGFGLAANSFFVALFSIVAFLITKLALVGRHEKILERKYGTHYKEYKKMVKF